MFTIKLYLNLIALSVQDYAQVDHQNSHLLRARKYLGEIFRTRPDRPWGPPSLLYNGYRLSFPGVKRPGRGINHPPPSRAAVKERVEL